MEIIPQQVIEGKILIIRGKKVMWTETSRNFMMYQQSD